MPIKAITRTILGACFYLRLLMTTKYFVVWTVFFFLKEDLLESILVQKKNPSLFLESFSHLATTIRAIYRLKCLYPGHNYNLI